MKQRDEKKETRKLPMSRRGKRFMVIYAALTVLCRVWYGQGIGRGKST